LDKNFVGKKQQAIKIMTVFAEKMAGIFFTIINQSQKLPLRKNYNQENLPNNKLYRNHEFNVFRRTYHDDNGQVAHIHVHIRKIL